MITASELAGYFAAHAIWNVSEADGMTPIFAFTNEKGEKKMERLMMPEASAAVAFGEQKLASNEMDADDAILAYDGRITINEKKVDAIIIIVRAYFSPDSKLTFAVPYSPKSSGNFKVFRLKIHELKNCEDFETDNISEAFWRGVDSHAEGVKVWNAHLDQSQQPETIEHGLHGFDG